MGGIRINSNIASMNAQRRLSRSTASLAESFTRLSSGLRINKASDDAAGLAISQSLNTDKQILRQGVRNLNDGVSLLSVADGALSELTNITVRLNELAQQASNGSLGVEQRGAIDAEAQALRAEYSRIAETTEFNGRKVFDRSFGLFRLQAGIGESGGIVSGLGGAVSTGTYQDLVSYAAGTDFQDTKLADVDGDGHLDIVGNDSAGDTLSILLGRGDGTFGDVRSVDMPASVNNLELVDFNNDGKVDIFWTGITSGVRLGNGDGTFTYAQSFAVASSTSTVADFNGDGALDLAIGNAGEVQVYNGLGNGTFEAVRTYEIENGTAMASSDFNGDGIVDIVSSSFPTGATEIALGNGDGSFKAGVSFSAGSRNSYVTVGDVNGDGLSDVISSHYSAHRVIVQLGNGDGTLQAARSFSTTRPTEARLLDADGDGNLDILALSSSATSLSILHGNGDGSFQSAVTTSVGATSTQLAIGDLNEDGVEDLVVGPLSVNDVRVLIANTEDGVAPLLDFSLKTLGEARNALPLFGQKLAQLASHRGQIGAFESRLSSALSTTLVASENYAAAESQISDTDVSVEVADLVKNQILQQAGVAILAQANLGPELALQLLQGAG